MQFNTLFSDFFFVTNFEDSDNKAIMDYFLSLEAENNGRVISNQGGFQTNDLIKGSCIALDDVINKTRVHIESLSDRLGFANLEISNVWGNVNRKHCYNGVHVHSNAIVSAVYYVKAEPDQGDLVFIRDKYPAEYIRKFYRTYENEHNRLEMRHTPKTGDLILFPAWVEHSVSANKTDMPRVSFAMNIDAAAVG